MTRPLGQTLVQFPDRNVHVLLQVAIGGAVGSVLRYAMGGVVSRFAGAGFPWGTLSVNATGSFAMGVVAAIVLLRSDAGLQRYAPLLMPGLLGGFTTFSAFSLDCWQLLERGRFVAGAAYVGGSVLFSVAALAAGMALVRAWSVP